MNNLHAGSGKRRSSDSPRELAPLSSSGASIIGKPDIGAAEVLSGFERANAPARGALEIGNETVRLGFTPALGGSLLHFSACLDGNWTTLTRDLSSQIKSSSDTASFMMVPYPNRIAGSSFNFGGKHYVLNNGKELAIHGYVRNRPWQIADLSSGAAHLRFDSRDFPEIDFPFPFTSSLRYESEGNSVRMRCDLINAGAEAMPAGCGYHPYFRRFGPAGDEAVLQFAAGGIYRYEGGVPVAGGPPQELRAEEDFSRSRVITDGFDHCFSGWDGTARIVWPKSKAGLIISASPNMGHLLLYSPPGEPFFAVEPQSQVINGFNLFRQRGDYSGVQVLEPGEKLSVWVQFSVERL